MFVGLTPPLSRYFEFLITRLIALTALYGAYSRAFLSTLLAIRRSDKSF